MKILTYRQFEKALFTVVKREPIQRSFPGKEQTVTLPSGDKLTGVVEKVDIDMISPVQEDWAVWNDTSKAMSMGEYVEVEDDFSTETVYEEGGILSEDNLPPTVIDKDNKIVDGHHRWAALQYAGFKKINIIRYEDQKI